MLAVATLLFALSAAAPDPSWTAEVDRKIATIFTRLDAEQAKFTEPENLRDRVWVKRKLQHMYDVDQLGRNALGEIDPQWPAEARQAFTKRLWERLSAIDHANTAELRKMMSIYGWLRISQFGTDGDKMAWLLVQHADDDVAFQEQVLTTLSEVLEEEETSPSNYAYLWDRVAMHRNKPQRYGTQGKCVAPGVWEPFEMEDPQEVDARRASVGLPSMQEYRAALKEEGLCP